MEIVDRQVQVFEDWDRKLRERILPLVRDEVIEEHAARPLGQHSDDLERVLAYFRRHAIPGKYVVIATKPWEEYRIGVMTGRRGHPAELLDDRTFATEEEAMHGVFLRRVQDLREG